MGKIFKKSRTFIAGFLTGAMIFGTVTYAAPKLSNIKAVLGTLKVYRGSTYAGIAPTIQYNSDTYISLKTLSKLSGGLISYNTSQVKVGTSTSSPTIPTQSGLEIKSYSMSYKILDWSMSHGGGLVPISENTDYLIVHIQAKNIGKTDTRPYDYFTIQNTQGREIGKEVNCLPDGNYVAGKLNALPKDTTIAPNASSEGYLVFSIPKGEKNLILVDNYISYKTPKVSLGDVSNKFTEKYGKEFYNFNEPAVTKYFQINVESYENDSNAFNERQVTFHAKIKNVSGTTQKYNPYFFTVIDDTGNESQIRSSSIVGSNYSSQDLKADAEIEVELTFEISSNSNNFILKYSDKSSPFGGAPVYAQYKFN